MQTQPAVSAHALAYTAVKYLYFVPFYPFYLSQ